MTSLPDDYTVQKVSQTATLGDVRKVRKAPLTKRQEKNWNAEGYPGSPVSKTGTSQVVTPAKDQRTPTLWVSPRPLPVYNLMKRSSY